MRRAMPQDNDSYSAFSSVPAARPISSFNRNANAAATDALNDLDSVYVVDDDMMPAAVPPSRSTFRNIYGPGKCRFGDCKLHF